MSQRLKAHSSRGKKGHSLQLEADGLLQRIGLHQARLGQSGVVQDLLGVIESEATKHSKAAVKRNLKATNMYASVDTERSDGVILENSLTASLMARVRIAVTGRTIGARDDKATTTRPPRRGPPMYRNWSLLAVAPTYESAPIKPAVCMSQAACVSNAFSRKKTNSGMLMKGRLT